MLNVNLFENIHIIFNCFRPRQRRPAANAGVDPPTGARRPQQEQVRRVGPDRDACSTPPLQANNEVRPNAVPRVCTDRGAPENVGA